jgi:hypothetical protein
MDNFLSSIPKLSDQSLEGEVIRQSGDVYDFNKILNSFTLTLLFLLNESFGHDLNRLPNIVTFTLIFILDRSFGYDLCFNRVKGDGRSKKPQFPAPGAMKILNITLDDLQQSSDGSKST